MEALLHELDSAQSVRAEYSSPVEFGNDRLYYIKQTGGVEDDEPMPMQWTCVAESASLHGWSGVRWPN